MPLLVTSASGANGKGYGALLAFEHDGEPLGPFSDDVRIVDPRGGRPNRSLACCSSTAPTACWRSIRPASGARHWRNRRTEPGRRDLRT